MSQPLTVLYDGTCVLCKRSKAKVESWRRAQGLRFIALQTPEARALLPGMDESSYLGAMHVVEEGKVYSAHEGWFRLMRLAPPHLRILAALTPRWIARPMYAWIARNRYKWFGKDCEGGTCQVHPSRSQGPGTRDQNGGSRPATGS